MESIWRQGQVMPHFPPLRGTVKTQVLVIGGGMAGLLCAHQLHQAGVDCCVVEENRIAGGVTGNTTAKITAGRLRTRSSPLSMEILEFPYCSCLVFAIISIPA